MIELSYIMFIIATLVLIAGIYVYIGRNNEYLLWRAYKKNRTKQELKNIGLGTIIASIFIFLIAVISFILEL